FILIAFVLAVVIAVVRGRVAGVTAKDALAEAVTPVTCMWAEKERRDLDEALDRLERLERDLAILKDRRA
uniref:hypothetical protein n=1 Tax=Puniceibacterium confluentis TaxID=1958944 RepID=UPI00164761EF